MGYNEDVKITDELLAVITAAVTAMGAKPGCRLVVRSMRRVQQNAPVWNATGRIERLGRNLNA